MDICITPSKLHGTLEAIPAKSHAHRAMICAALADTSTTLFCRETNRDIEATAQCLTALGAQISRVENGYHILPIGSIPQSADLYCGESGSTLRFLLPLVGVLGVNATFHMEGRLPDRPLSPLVEEMERMGCSITRPTQDTLCCSGKLRNGEFRIPGNISSQYITGLLLALIHLNDTSNISVHGKLESQPYVNLTLKTLAQFGATPSLSHIEPATPLHSPGKLTVEGDWSNAAFYLAAQALGSNLHITGLCEDSAQGDRVIRKLLSCMDNRITVNVQDIPDLVPILAITAACKKGAVFTNIQRLRMKESDRVQSTIHMIRSLGGKAWEENDLLFVEACQFTGGTVDSYNDHRIAMAAAIAATCSSGPVTILGSNCIEKSYPSFWEEYHRLGGNYEQYLR